MLDRKDFRGSLRTQKFYPGWFYHFLHVFSSSEKEFNLRTMLYLVLLVPLTHLAHSCLVMPDPSCCAHVLMNPNRHGSISNRPLKDCNSLFTSTPSLSVSSSLNFHCKKYIIDTKGNYKMYNIIMLCTQAVLKPCFIYWFYGVEHGIKCRPIYG